MTRTSESVYQSSTGVHRRTKKIKITHVEQRATREKVWQKRRWALRTRTRRWRHDGNLPTSQVSRTRTGGDFLLPNFSLNLVLLRVQIVLLAVLNPTLYTEWHRAGVAWWMTTTDSHFQSSGHWCLIQSVEFDRRELNFTETLAGCDMGSLDPSSVPGPRSS